MSGDPRHDDIFGKPNREERDGRRSAGPGERGRAARQQDRDATERDEEAARRDLRDTVRHKLMEGRPGQEERDLSRIARVDAQRDREAAARDRERAAHDREIADFERRGRYG